MLSSSLNAVEIAHALQDATPREVDFQILPGWRLEEIAAALPTSGLNISPEEFLQVTLTSSGIAVPDGFPGRAFAGRIFIARCLPVPAGNQPVEYVNHPYGEL